MEAVPPSANALLIIVSIMLAGCIAMMTSVVISSLVLVQRSHRHVEGILREYRLKELAHADPVAARLQSQAAARADDPTTAVVNKMMGQIRDARKAANDAFAAAEKRARRPPRTGHGRVVVGAPDGQLGRTGSTSHGHGDDRTAREGQE